MNPNPLVQAGDAVVDEARLRRSIKRLATKWRGGRLWYQCVDFTPAVSTEPHTGGKARLRTESFTRYIADFVTPDDVVLDIGCNAGLFTLLAGERCRKAVGVEIDKAFHRQGLFLRDFFAEVGRDVSRVELRHMDLLDDLSVLSDTTVVFASKVLYHQNLGDRVFELMDAITQSPTRIILAQGHTTQGERGQIEGMRTMFARAGFGFRLLQDVPEYPLVVGERAA